MSTTTENTTFGATPATAPDAPTTTVAVEAKTDNRKGQRKSTGTDGTVSYGVKPDGTPRRKPGRRPKSS